MYCKACKVELRGSPERCPLCQQTLHGEEERSEAVFPQIGAPPKGLIRLLKFLAFLSVMGAVVSVAVNLSFPGARMWSLWVLAGLGSLWLSFGLILRKRDNIHKTIVWEVALISLLALLWDISTGFHGWSLDFVFPIICVGAMILMAVVAQIIKLDIEDYLIYLVIDSVLGILCLILLALDWIRIILPSVICVVSSILSLSALLIFEGGALRRELRRRLHL